MSFSGSLLERGFWLYVWRITAQDGRQVLQTLAKRFPDTVERYKSGRCGPWRGLGAASVAGHRTM